MVHQLGDPACVNLGVEVVVLRGTRARGTGRTIMRQQNIHLHVERLELLHLSVTELLGVEPQRSRVVDTAHRGELLLTVDTALTVKGNRSSSGHERLRSPGPHAATRHVEQVRAKHPETLVGQLHLALIGVTKQVEVVVVAVQESERNVEQASHEVQVGLVVVDLVAEVTYLNDVVQVRDLSQSRGNVVGEELTVAVHVAKECDLHENILTVWE